MHFLRVLKVGSANILIKDKEPMEEAIKFKNRKAQMLYGIMHIPDRALSNRHDIGIHILNPGLKNRVAPNRLNVKLARMLCASGFHVLRSDPHGIGDSQGHLSEHNDSVFNMWSLIQSGAFVADTIDANSMFIDRFNLKKLILIGQCGAGVTALLASALDYKIESLILIDTPFRIVPTNLDIRELMDEYGSNVTIIHQILNFIKNPTKIRKLFKLDFDYRFYAKYIGKEFKSLICRDSNKKGNDLHKRFNWPMAKAFEKFIKRNKKIYFNYAENDFSLREFNEDFCPNYLDTNSAYLEGCKVDIIKNANHIYTETQWQLELFSNIGNWLKV